MRARASRIRFQDKRGSGKIQIGSSFHIPIAVREHRRKINLFQLRKHALERSHFVRLQQPSAFFLFFFFFFGWYVNVKKIQNERSLPQTHNLHTSFLHLHHRRWPPLPLSPAAPAPAKGEKKSEVKKTPEALLPAAQRNKETKQKKKKTSTTTDLLSSASVFWGALAEASPLGATSAGSLGCGKGALSPAGEACASQRTSRKKKGKNHLLERCQRLKVPHPPEQGPGWKQQQQQRRQKRSCLCWAWNACLLFSGAARGKAFPRPSAFWPSWDEALPLAQEAPWKRLRMSKEAKNQQHNNQKKKKPTNQAAALSPLGQEHLDVVPLLQHEQPSFTRLAPVPKPKIKLVFWAKSKKNTNVWCGAEILCFSSKS